MQHLSSVTMFQGLLEKYFFSFQLIFVMNILKSFLDCSKMIAITTVISVDWFQDEEYFYVKGFLN